MAPIPVKSGAAQEIFIDDADPISAITSVGGSGSQIPVVNVSSSPYVVP